MKAYAIRNKTTKEYWSGVRGKMCWTTIGAAKCAWFNSCRWRNNHVSFDEQTEYEIVLLVPDDEDSTV